MENELNVAQAPRIEVEPITAADAALAATFRGAESHRLQFHEFANIFPMPDADKLGELAEDISEHGLRDLIVRYEGKILDGRRRYLACQKARVEPNFEDFVGTAAAAMAFVVSRNLHRRHMGESQRAMVAAKIANLSIGANQHSEGTPIGAASKLFNVSPRSIARAKEILSSGNSDLIADVEAGNVAVSAAAAAIRKASDAAPAANTHPTAADDIGDVIDRHSVSMLGHTREPSADDAGVMRACPSRTCEDILKPGVKFIVGSAASAVMPMAIKMAATVSASEKWPDHTRPDAGDVVWLSTQMNAREQLGPKIRAAGADMQRLHFPDAMRDEFGLPIRNLGEELRRLNRDWPPETTAIFIDYLAEYFSAGVFTPDAFTCFRAAIDKMNKIATEKSVTIIAVLQAPTRNDRLTAEAVQVIATLPNVEAVMHVEHGTKKHKGSLSLSVDLETKRFSFQLRHHDSVGVVSWDAIYEAGAFHNLRGDAHGK